MSRRKRAYHYQTEFYGDRVLSYGDRRYGEGSAVYAVIAVSASQARYLADNEIWATDANSVGLRELAIKGIATFPDNRPGWERVTCWGIRMRAPYLRRAHPHKELVAVSTTEEQ